jgi:lipoic acid synthetase
MQKPGWLKIRFVRNPYSQQVAKLMERYGLHSVCQSAHCPNCMECWSQGTASFMVMGEYCTRGCGFCAVRTLGKIPPPEPDEPENLAKAAQELGLKYVVVTSVARDDLKDGGAGHFAKCVRALRKRNPEIIIETLIPDFRGKKSALKKLVDAKPDVISHNIETVERLTKDVRDARAGYKQSIDALKMARKLSAKKIITKSGMMVGLGESRKEVYQAMKDVKDAGVEIFTIGQYLQPSPRHVKLKQYVKPETFRLYEKKGYELGFRYMACGPFVRSSYKAGEPFIKKLIKPRVAH